MKKLSGLQKVGLIAGVGCLSIIGMLFVGIVVAFVWARSTVAQYGDPTPTAVERSISLQAPSAEAPDPSILRGAPAPGAEPLQLTIDLQEGIFTVRPGPPGGQVQVQGTYAAGLYELVERHDTGTDGAPRASIRFHAKAPVWARVLSSMVGGGSDERPNLTVIIPQGSPMDLSLRVAMGESRIDLGGLTLRELDVAVSMGEHRIDFGQPVATEMRRVRLDASMGNVSVENLGNTRAPTIETSGSMGNLTADLGGAWAPGEDAAISFSQSMGELTVRVPSGVRLEADVRDTNGRAQNAEADSSNPQADPKAPLLKLRVVTSMGGSRVIRY